MRPLRIFALIITLTAGVCLLRQEASAQPGTYQVFYDNLSPYGTWVDHPIYGSVWIPYPNQVPPDFTPYATAGHWVYTDYGWTWASDYPWGWATFHYGRWDFDYEYGWFWVPGYEWAPAWVSWRRSPGYYGWAPLRPGVGERYPDENDRWIFVDERYVASPYVYRHYEDRRQNVTIINNSTVIVISRQPGATYVGGPDRVEVQGVTHRQVNVVRIQTTDQPGGRVSGKELQIYRPEVREPGPNEPKPAPKNLAKWNDASNVPHRAPQKPSQNMRPIQRAAENTQPPQRSGGVQQSKSRSTATTNNNGKRQQKVTPVGTVQKTKPPASRNVKSPNNNGKKPQKVTPPDKDNGKNQ
jgi:hypothetical protein